MFWIRFPTGHSHPSRALPGFAAQLSDRPKRWLWSSMLSSVKSPSIFLVRRLIILGRGTPKLSRTLHRVRDYVELLVVRRRDPDFANTLVATAPYSLLSQRKRASLYREAQQVVDRAIPGVFVEIGVYRGGAAALLAAVASQDDRAIHLFDRWGDLPTPTEEDEDFAVQFAETYLSPELKDLRAGDQRAEVEKRLTGDFLFPRENLFLEQGWFQDTFPHYSGGPIAFAHIDADWYESMKLALAFVDRHLGDGGTVVLDDWDEWPGVKKAYFDYQQSTSRQIQLRVRRDQAVLRIGPVRA